MEDEEREDWRDPETGKLIEKHGNRPLKDDKKYEFLDDDDIKSP